jgi:hypothetical protein
MPFIPVKGEAATAPIRARDLVAVEAIVATDPIAVAALRAEEVTPLKADLPDAPTDAKAPVIRLIDEVTVPRDDFNVEMAVETERIAALPAVPIVANVLETRPTVEETLLKAVRNWDIAEDTF